MQQEQQAVLQVLISVYAIAVLINSLISALLFVRQRDQLTRAQLFIWAATFGALVVQGASGPALPGALIGLASVFAVSAAIANLLSIVSGIPVAWRVALPLLLLGFGASAGAHVAGLAFVLVTAPVLVGVAFPILSNSIAMLVRRRGRLSSSELGMGVASVFYGLHMLDFALLGDKPEFGPFGFSLGLLCIFALSIFAPAVVVEKITTSTARTAAEMDAARRIQTQLLPQSPELPGLKLSCYMRPADEVGGDYYDILQLEGRSWILLGDVTGHGLSSGLVMLMAQSVMSSILHSKRDISPGQLNLLANRILHQNLARMGEERTMTIVSLSTAEGDEIVFSGAHDNLYIHRATSGEVEVVEVSQFPFQLGLIDDIPEDIVGEARFTLQPGDTVFVITDGVTEAANKGDYKLGIFDEPRLIQYIRSNAGQPLDAIRDGLVAELDRFTGGVYHDDVTFLIARKEKAA